jgi:hypothetical protein
MSTRIMGQLMEDVEVSTVKDLSLLFIQLKAALQESGGTTDGLAVDKAPVIGVVYAPMINELFLGVCGYGAFRNDIFAFQRTHHYDFASFHY